MLLQRDFVFYYSLSRFIFQCHGNTKKLRETEESESDDKSDEGSHSSRLRWVKVKVEKEEKTKKVIFPVVATLLPIHGENPPLKNLPRLTTGVARQW